MSVKIKPVRLLGGPGLKFVKTFPTYVEAVHHGQQYFGKKKFMIETPGRVPTRSEQLCRGKSVRQTILETL